MKKLKVLFEAGPLTDSKKTGVGYYVEHAIRALATNQSLDKQLEGYYFNFLGLNQNYLPRIPHVRFHRIWLVPGKLLSLCRRFGRQPYLELFTWRSGDIIFFTNYVMLPALRRHKKVLAIYDLGFIDHPEYVQPVNLAYLQRFCPPSIQKADLIITISEFTKQRIQEHFPAIHAPIAITPIPPAPIERHSNVGLNKRLQSLGVHPQHYLLYLGTIEPRKNLQLLMQAYAGLDANLRKAYSLVLAGGKGWKDEAILADIATLQAKGIAIITTGYVTDAEKDALYANCRGFVLPSHYEGFGMPVLEAMQHGIPVAVSDLPVFHEAAGKAALYFNKDNADDITHALRVLLTDDSRREDIIKAGKQQLASFSWTKNAEILLAAFGALAQERQEVEGD